MKNKLARVFPTKTNMSPSGPDIYFGYPNTITPEYDKVYISVTFTWDIPKAKELEKAWRSNSKKVYLGGPAFNDPGEDFCSGMFLKKDVTITSRGCNNNCWFCFAPKREGKIREINIEKGNIIQDNNILQCSDRHINKVFDMLKHEKQIEFKGGLEVNRITSKIVEKLRGLRIRALWLSCDTELAMKPLKKAVKMLHKAGFKQYILRCYVLIGSDLKEDEERLREVYKIGCMPFAQLFECDKMKKKEYNKEWKTLSRNWSLPAIYRSIMKDKK